MLAFQIQRGQTLGDATLPAPARSARASAAKGQGTASPAPPAPCPQEGQNEREGGLKPGKPGFVRCRRSTSLPAGRDHAVIGVLAMNSAEKGESASENLQLSSHFSTKELTTFVLWVTHASLPSTPFQKETGTAGALLPLLHAHTYRTPFPPQSSRIHSKKLNYSKILSPIEVLCWFHTSLTFHVLCYQSLFWVLFCFGF